MPTHLCSSRVIAWSFLVVLALAGVPRADPAPSPDVTGAPVPGQESGQVVTDRAEPSTARAVARGALFVPRVATEIVLVPVRGGVWLWDRYDLDQLYYETFYNDDRTLGVIPTIMYQTGFGFMAGARLISTDTFGGGENLTVEGGYGGTYQAQAALWLDTGDRLGPVTLTGGGNFDRFARLPFYGIGNEDDVSPPPAMLIDPLVDDTAVETHYRYQELRAGLLADWRVFDGVHVVARGDITDLDFGSSTTDPPLDAVYDPMDVVGFTTGVEHLYGELALTWDRRRTARLPWETTEYSTGWYANAYVGGVHGFDDTQGFAHYGFDLQGFLHFALGPRMLVLRLRGEGVTGDIDEVPFTELPYLGGDLLRGYDFARFRDRVSALGTAQYVYDLSRFVNAFAFVDAGRVFSSVDDLTFDDMRVGFGGGLEIHSKSDFVVSGTIATSVDGGVFVTASLNSLWNEVPRWR